MSAGPGRIPSAEPLWGLLLSTSHCAGFQPAAQGRGVTFWGAWLGCFPLFLEEEGQLQAC